MFFTLLRQWVMTPFENYRLFHHFTRQDFVAQYASSIGGFLWLFVTPIAHIIIYAFVIIPAFSNNNPGDLPTASANANQGR